MNDTPLMRHFKLPTPFFQLNSAWRQKVTTVDPLPESDWQIQATYELLRQNDINTMLINAGDYSVPIFQATMAETKDMPICNYDGGQWAPSPPLEHYVQNGRIFVRNIPRPTGPIRPAGPTHTGADGHVALVNLPTHEVYDFWQATTQRQPNHGQELCHSVGGGQEGSDILETGSVAYFKTDGPGSQGPSNTPLDSARGTGVPLFGGLLLPEDLEAGVDSIISHALSFILPGLRYFPTPSPSDPPNYLYPATKTETDGNIISNPYALAAGQRIRLKQTLVDLNGHEIVEENNGAIAPITRIFFRALREYGAYVVDRGGGFVFFAEDWHTAWLDIDEAQVKALIGSLTLPANKTFWQIVMDKLYEQLSWEFGGIPFALERNGQLIANFEVVDHAQPAGPVYSIYMPMVLRG